MQGLTDPNVRRRWGGTSRRRVTVSFRRTWPAEWGKQRHKRKRIALKSSRNANMMALASKLPSLEENSVQHNQVYSQLVENRVVNWYIYDKEVIDCIFSLAFMNHNFIWVWCLMHLDRLDEKERITMMNNLKLKWADTNAQYQQQSVVLDMISKIRRKERYTEQLLVSLVYQILYFSMFVSIWGGSWF